MAKNSGPWVIDEFLEELGVFKIRPTNSALCHIHVYSGEAGGHTDSELADARLVAAAPALLDGLTQAVEQLETDYRPSTLDGHGALIRKLRAVLEKAGAA